MARTAPPAPSFTASGFFVLRTPALPLDAFLKWSADLRAPGAHADGRPDTLEEALRQDRARLREDLRARVRDPAIRDALYVASPDLMGRLSAWEADPGSSKTAEIERALVRYFTRMSSRPTPFGLFAGGSTGSIGDKTRLHLAPAIEHRRHTRLDMHYLASLAEGLCADPDLRRGAGLWPSSSLYRSGGKLRYVEGRTAEGTRERSYHLVAVEPAQYLIATLARAAGGARLDDLVSELVASDPEIKKEDAEGYVTALIDAQILVPDLEAGLTGAEPIEPLIAALRAQPAGKAAAERLEGARAALAEIDRRGAGVAQGAYEDLARGLAELPAPVEISRLFQVDLFKHAPDATIGTEIVEELARGAELLQRIAPPRPAGDLERFREAFVARYEAREVDLYEALDQDSGIGFGPPGAGDAEASPLLEGLELPERIDRTTPFGDRDAFLLEKLRSAWSAGEKCIELDQDALKALAATDPRPLPDAFSVMATIGARSEEALSRGDFQAWIHGIAGPSGAVLFGRFCHGDPALRKAVEAHLRAEEEARPGVIFAEIVHLPQGRSGNVIARPALRAHEIAYMGRSGVEPASRIPIADLRVSVRGRRVVLRSARLDREVIPRLTSAHNFALGDVPLYRFLCALQAQDGQGASWDWGALWSASFLPRITHGRMVVSPARWRLAKPDLDRLATASGAALFREVQALKARLELPRRVILADGDNALVVDTDNVLSIEAFVQIVRRREIAFLTELFPDPEALCVLAPEGRFTHELVLPFVRQSHWTSDQAPRAPLEPRDGARVVRSFPPGSEWFYAKLYTGTVSADSVLREVVRPVVERALASGAADSWFFIRYGDPEWHIRLRLHGSPDGLRDTVFPALEAAASPLRADGRIWKTQLDTYEREIERYGGAESIELAERLFDADSAATLEIIATLEGDAGAEARWKLAFFGVHALLGDLGLDLDARIALLDRARSGLEKELGTNEAFARQLDRRYRLERPELDRLIDPTFAVQDSEHWLAPGITILRERSEMLAPTVALLCDRARSGRLTATLPDLASSFIHMHANRLLRSAARAQELALYDFLDRTYVSQAARARRNRGR